MKHEWICEEGLREGNVGRKENVWEWMGKGEARRWKAEENWKKQRKRNTVRDEESNQTRQCKREKGGRGDT